MMFTLLIKRKKNCEISHFNGHYTALFADQLPIFPVHFSDKFVDLFI